MTTEAPTLAPTERTTLHRRPNRGGHGLAEIDAILDAGLICQIGYVMDGEPRVPANRMNRFWALDRSERRGRPITRWSTDSALRRDAHIVAATHNVKVRR